MSNEENQEQWRQALEKIRQAHPQLSYEDLDYQLGKEEELLERLQEKLGKTKQEIRNWLHLMG